MSIFIDSREACARVTNTFLALNQHAPDTRGVIVEMTAIIKETLIGIGISKLRNSIDEVNGGMVLGNDFHKFIIRGNF